MWACSQEATDTMFKRIHINGFRSFESFDVKPLGRFNLIVGPGSVGKTNFLECVFLACSNGDASLLHREQGLRRIQIDTLLPSEVVGYYDLAWSTWNKSQRFSIEAVWEGEERSITCSRIEQKGVVSLKSKPGKNNPLEEGERPSEPLGQYEIETKVNGHRYLGQLTVTHKQISFRGGEKANISARYLHPFFQDVSRLLPRIWTTVEDDKEDEAILELLQSLDSAIQTIRIGSNEAGIATLRVHHKFLGRLPLESFGAGFGKALAIASYVVAAKNGVLILDELDASLHIGAQTKLVGFLLRAAAKYNVQLFASTHSLETVDTFLDCFEDVSGLLGSPQDLQVLQFSKRRHRTEVKQADASEARKLREDLGLDLRRT